MKTLNNGLLTIVRHIKNCFLILSDYHSVFDNPKSLLGKTVLFIFIDDIKYCNIIFHFT